MPIYEYQCSSCGNAFEELVLARGVAAPQCPQCGAKETNRMISTFAPGVATAGKPKASGGDVPTCGRCGDLGPCAGGGA